MLIDVDATYLQEQGWTYEVTPEAGVLCLVLRDFSLPPGYTQTSADLLIHLPVGYPDTPLDMWWFSPAVQRSDGVTIRATESSGVYLGRSWQRWSRHYQPGQWQPGIDSLRSYVARIRAELRACAAPGVAA